LILDGLPEFADFFSIRERIMATIDKDLLKQIVNAKQPRNYIFVEGSEDKVLVVNKAKIGGDEQKSAIEKAKNGKVTSRGKIQVEQTEDGKKKVVFFTKQPNDSLVPKLRRALKQQVGLSRVVEIRGLREEQEDGEDPIQVNQVNNVQNGNQGNRQRSRKIEQPKPQFKNIYDELRAALLEDVELLKELKPKAVAKIEQQLQEAEKSIGPEQKGDLRYKDSAKTLKKLADNVAKLKQKASPGKEQQTISDRATYKTMRTWLAPRIYSFADIDRDLTQKMINLLALEADPLVDDKLPESKRNYKKALAILEKIKQALDKREKQANSEGQQIVPLDDNSDLYVVPAAIREAKQRLAILKERIPDAKEVVTLQQVLDVAKDEYQRFRTEFAKDSLQDFAKQIAVLEERCDQAFKSLETTRAMVRQTQLLTSPRIPHRRAEMFAGYLQGAEELLKKGQLNEATSGARALETQVRQALSDRKLMVESSKNIGVYLDQAATDLPENEYRGFESRYLNAYATFEYGDFKAAYDEITKVESELANALRNLPQRIEREQKENVGGTSKVDKLKKGLSNQGRQLQFKLNVEGVRRGFSVFKEIAPKSLSRFEKWLGEVLKLEKENFDQAEKDLASLVRVMNSSMPFLKEPKSNEEEPQPLQPRRPPQRPVPKPPETTQEWAKRIDRGKLKIEEKNKLGSGGQGSVYKLGSQDPKSPGLVMKIPRSQREEDLIELQVEAKAYELIGDHPNIIKSLGIQTIDGKQGLVLEQVKGKEFDQVTGNLKARLQKGEITHAQFWGSIQYTLSKTLEVLDHMHSKGLAHNDIKPENIMIDETTGDVKVFDMGVISQMPDPMDSTPQYRAPELIKGSSPQSDVFATGASAYQMTEGEHFHFNQKGKTGDLRQIATKYGEFIGDVGEDELGISQPSELNPIEEPRNDQGQVDPNGPQRKRNDGVAGGKTAYTEFMNWLLHPDPKKRPSPKEALQHPFLRDRILSDTQVKEMICENLVDPPLEQFSKEPLRGLAEESRKYATKVNTVKALESAQDLLQLDLDELDTEQMLKKRLELDQMIERAIEAVRIIDNGVRALESITKNAATRNSSGFFQDLEDLDTLKQALEGWKNAESGVSQLLLKLNKALLTTNDQENEEPNSEIMTVERVNERIRVLKTRRAEIQKDEEKARNGSSPLYEKLQDLLGFRRQVEGLKGRNKIEKQLIVKFMKANKGGNHQLEAFNVAKDFQAYLKDVDFLQSRTIVDIEDVELGLKELAQDITRLENSAKELLETLDIAMTEMGQEGLKFESQAKKPRNTQEAMEQFELARSEFAKKQQILREQQQKFQGKAGEFLRRAYQLSKQIGPLAASGMEDLPGRLKRFEHELKRLMGELN